MVFGVSTVSQKIFINGTNVLQKADKEVDDDERLDEKNGLEKALNNY